MECSWIDLLVSVNLCRVQILGLGFELSLIFNDLLGFLIFVVKMNGFVPARLVGLTERVYLQ